MSKITCGMNGFGRFGLHLLNYYLDPKNESSFDLKYINDDLLNINQALDIIVHDKYVKIYDIYKVTIDNDFLYGVYQKKDNMIEIPITAPAYLDVMKRDLKILKIDVKKNSVEDTLRAWKKNAKNPIKSVLTDLKLPPKMKAPKKFPAPGDYTSKLHLIPNAGEYFQEYSYQHTFFYCTK